MDTNGTPSRDATLLLFTIRGIHCGVPAQSVDTIVMPPRQLTHPPGSSRSRPGIFAHSGRIHAVVDLREAFGLLHNETPEGRLLLYHFGAHHYAFVVDAVVGLIHSTEGQWVALPPDLPRRTFTRGFLYRDEIVLCSDFPRLLRLEDGEPLRRHFASLVAARELAAPLTEPSATPPTPPPLPQYAVTATTADLEPHQRELPKSPSQSSPPVPPRRNYAAPAPRPRPPLSVTPASVAKLAARAPLQQRPIPAQPRPLPIEPPAARSRTPAPPPSTGLLPALVLLLALLGGGWWLWPPAQTSTAPPAAQRLATPPPQPSMTQPPPHQTTPLRLEKGRAGVTLIVEESAFNTQHSAASTAPEHHEERRIIHQVRKGETLWGIAEHYVHDPWRFRELARQSDIDNPNLIYPGDQVTIVIR